MSKPITAVGLHADWKCGLTDAELEGLSSHSLNALFDAFVTAIATTRQESILQPEAGEGEGSEVEGQEGGKECSFCGERTALYTRYLKGRSTTQRECTVCGLVPNAPSEHAQKATTTGDSTRPKCCSTAMAWVGVGVQAPSALRPDVAQLLERVRAEIAYNNVNGCMVHEDNGQCPVIGYPDHRDADCDTCMLLDDIEKALENKAPSDCDV